MNTRKIALTVTAALIVAGVAFSSGFAIASANGDAQVATATSSAQTVIAGCVELAEWHAPMVAPACVLGSEATVNDYLTMRCICG